MAPPPTIQVDQALHALEALAEAAMNDDLDELDEKTRSRFYAAARKLSLRIESDAETMQRIDYSPILLAVLKTAYDVNLFESLVEPPGPPKTLDELALATRVHPDLLSRLLKFCAANHIVAETRSEEYAPTRMTRSLATRGFRGAVKHHHGTTMRAAQALPDFLKRTHYANPNDYNDTAFHQGVGGKEGFFDFLKTNPDLSDSFNDYMSAVKMSPTPLGELYDFHALWGSNTNPHTVLFVDVGGGNGHQCLALRKSTHGIGRVIVQDLPEVVKDLTLDEVEVMHHNFFEPQPVRGAKVYYFRTIMHDWVDDDCRTILRHISDAMDDESVILLDERMIAKQDAHWIAMNMDLAMMLLFSAKERSELQWRELLGSVGLQIKSINLYGESGQCLTEAIKIPQDGVTKARI